MFVFLEEKTHVIIKVEDRDIKRDMYRKSETQTEREIGTERAQHRQKERWRDTER